jgi:hypothetical protein
MLDPEDRRLLMALDPGMRGIAEEALGGSHDNAQMRDAMARTVLLTVAGMSDPVGPDLATINSEDRRFVTSSVSQLDEHDRSLLSVFSNQVTRLARSSRLDLPPDLRRHHPPFPRPR